MPADEVSDELARARALAERAIALLAQVHWSGFVAASAQEPAIRALLAEFNGLPWRREVVPIGEPAATAALPLVSGWCRPASRNWRWR